MWGWLTAILKALFDWGQKQAEKPKTLENANTPKADADALNDQFNDFMRHKDKRDN